MSKRTKAKGLGTWALGLGLISSFWLSTLNGQSIVGYLSNVLEFHNSYIIVGSVLLFAIPGAIIGLSHLRHWGAKLGTLLCAYYTVSAIISLVKLATA